MKKILSILALFSLFAFKIDNLPDVLIIGDSISIGYTPFVKKEFEGRAHVVHNEGNAKHTGIGLEKLDEWLGETQWEAIHFNWGLWDLCYRLPGENGRPGEKDKVQGKITFTPEQYAKNLEAMVLRLKKTRAKLIFATTTCVPEGEPGRFAEDVDKYNKAALKIMKKHDVTVNHLGRLSRKVHKKYALAAGDVHYTREGYAELAEPVIEMLLKAVSQGSF